MQSLTGQVVFMDAEEGRLVLDCLLSRPGETATRPVTLQATMVQCTELGTAIGMLKEWAEELAEVDVTITGSGSKAELTISSGSGLLHLAPVGAGAGTS